MSSIQTDIKTLQREILELKTAQNKPSILNTYMATMPILGGYYNTGLWSWTITYKDDGSNWPPITTIIDPALNAYLKPANENTQKIYFYSGEDGYYIGATTGTVLSSREILSITQDQTPLQHEWTQVRDFYPADMGTTPGWCLQNTRRGFHIYSGTFPTARADMNSQIANGTLHSGTPPDYIACAVYWDNSIAEGHVGAWDHGTIYSDGVIYPSFDSIDAGYRGWGELCDGARVVQHI